MKLLSICTLFSFLSSYAFSQMTGHELLEKSIRYHDPKSKWEKAELTFNLKQDTPSRPKKLTTFKINNKKNIFWQKDVSGRNIVIRSLEKDTCKISLNGKTTFSEDEVKMNRLTCQMTRFWRDYQTYLYGLPMKLKDPGTKIHEKVKMIKFQDKNCWQLKVSYAEPVGHDTWYFYFHLKTYALVGYRFYHDESKNDGEYIILEDEIQINDIRFPRDRKWYFNIDDKFLGMDYIHSGK